MSSRFVSIALGSCRSLSLWRTVLKTYLLKPGDAPQAPHCSEAILWSGFPTETQPHLPLRGLL